MKLQQKKKLLAKKCCFCGEDNYTLLDCHRIIPGSKYTDWGTIVVCSNCHRRIHNNEITILGKHNSTAGTVINYLEEDNEKWTLS